MNHTFSIWLVLLAALAAANLPFLNDRWLAVIARSAPKTLGIRLVELLLLYLLVGALGLALEQSAGQIAPQGWEFYATTGAMFLTLAFPGFVYRYLFKRRG
jgi:surface polysaccharide O-acyltransferase-like enzyme